MRQVRERVRAAADAKSSYVFVDCTCERAWLQPDAFAEALFELLDNAVRATRAGYPVIVDVRAAVEGAALWQIQDAGEGMSDGCLAELGQRSRAVRPERHGSGLAFALEVVDKHRGTIRFESARRVGTTVTLWVPATPECPSGDKSRTNAKHGTGGPMAEAGLLALEFEPAAGEPVDLRVRLEGAARIRSR
jgi:signal transduction histidine kinase